MDRCPVHGTQLTTGGCMHCPPPGVFPHVFSPPGPAPIWNTTSTTHPARFAVGRDSEDYVTITTYDDKSAPLTTMRMSERLARWLIGELTHAIERKPTGSAQSESEGSNG